MNDNIPIILLDKIKKTLHETATQLVFELADDLTLNMFNQLMTNYLYHLQSDYIDLKNYKCVIEWADDTHKSMIVTLTMEMSAIYNNVNKEWRITWDTHSINI